METAQTISLARPGRIDRAYVDEVRRVTWVGVAVNVLLASAKFVAGFLGASQAVVADAVHSISDTVSDGAILIGVRYWTAPPDDTHPHGHRRIETVVTVLIGALLAAVAIGLVYNAVKSLPDQSVTPPGWIAFGAALLSIISKEVLYRWTVVRGKRIKSSAVIANAWHHRSDAFSSIPAALAVLGARIHPAWSFLDHIGAVVVAIFIFQAAAQIAWPALAQLVDAGAPKRACAKIKEIALATEGVRHVHAIRSRYIGSGLQVDLHIQVDGHMSVREGHEISAAVKYRLLELGPDVVDIVVHLEPYSDAAD